MDIDLRRTGVSSALVVDCAGVEGDAEIGGCALDGLEVGLDRLDS